VGKDVRDEPAEPLCTLVRNRSGIAAVGVQDDDVRAQVGAAGFASAAPLVKATNAAIATPREVSFNTSTPSVRVEGLPQ
jgi:hypothetical protein